MMNTQATSLSAADHRWQDELAVAPAAASHALLAVGIEPRGVLAGALVHASTDVLLAATIARSLPSGADFLAALSGLQTLSAPQPVPVLRAQVKLLAAIQRLRQESASDAHNEHPLGPTEQQVAERLQVLIGAVEDELRNAEAGLAEELAHQ